MLKIEGRERRRLASYLHDKISQMLVVIRVKCGILKEYFNKKETDGLIDEINTLLDQTIKDTRSLTFELSPPILNELGFAPAIEWIGEKISKDNDIRIKFKNDKQPKPMDDDMGTFLFRAVQELLTNIVKHSQAQNAKIGIRKKGGFVHIVVEDDGIGFDILEMESFNWRFSKFGLFSIQKQMERIGGNIKIKSESGQGTSITMAAPLKNADTSAKDSKT